jgi:hypothetical protein
MPVTPANVTLYDVNGEPSELPHEHLTDDELRLLLEYKRFLQAHGYREAVYCTRCWDRNLADGTQFQVQASGLTVEAMIKCRCRMAYGKGGGLH